MKLPIGPPGIEDLDAVVALVGQEIQTESRVDRGDVEGGELGPGGRLERSDRLRVAKLAELGTRRRRCRRCCRRLAARPPSPAAKAAVAGIGDAVVEGVVGGEVGRPPAIVGVSDKASSAGASAPATKPSRAEFLAGNPVIKRPSRFSVTS
jgi:hypothetical protein